MRSLFGLVVVVLAANFALADDSANPKTVTDLKILEEIKANNQLMKNLGHLSDAIGPRLTGSANLETANKWAAEKMKEYGLNNVHLEPYEIPIGWTRGTATLTLIEPMKRQLLAASAGWAPGTDGPITGPVVLFEPRTKKDLEAFRGKLKGAILLRGKPANVAPVTDTSYGPGRPRREPPKEGEPKRETPNYRDNQELQEQLIEFYKAEGVAATLRDSGKPHGLLVTTGGWKDDADRVTAKATVPNLFLTHEHYALLYRMVMEHKDETKVELNVTNKFSDGPVTVYNTVGELPGTEKPEEFVIVGAHLDSWDLASGTTDNGTGSSVVLEIARTLSKLAQQGIRPKRTIRFVLFTGEEEGLHGSKNYVKQHAKEMDKVSATLVHDTGTGKVMGLHLMGRNAIASILGPEIETLKQVGFEGLVTTSMGGTDHLPFEKVGVPGFPCKQDMDEYRFTHHTQSDTFDKAKPANLVQGAQVLAVTAFRIADLDNMLPRDKPKRERDTTPMPEKKP